MFKKAIKILMAASTIGALGCGAQQEDIASTEGAVLGDALAGTNATTFAAAKANFAAAESAADGLGPIFNEHSCGACHANGAVGGAGQNIERRYGTLTNGVFDPLASTGGSLRQLFGIGGFNVGGLNCQSGTDANPAPGATIFAGRLTTPLFGLGLVDSLPDAALRHARQPRAGGDPRHRQPRHASRCRTRPTRRRARRRHPRRPLRLEGAACRTWVSSRRTPT